MTPKRIQRKRTKGYKQPPNTRYCGRGTMYGNRHYIIDVGDAWIVYDREDLSFQKHFITCYTLEDAHAKAVELYDADLAIWLEHNPNMLDDLLKYENVSCMCPLHLPCHVDAIIKRLPKGGEDGD